MAGRPRVWDDYLFRDHGLIALDPWRSDVELLDILVKIDSKAIGKVGSMISLGDESVPEWNSVRTRLSSQLASLRGERGGNNLDDFQKGEHGEISVCAKRSSKILGRLLGAGFATAQANVQGDSGFTITARNVTFARVKGDSFTRFVTNWRPDKARPELQRPTQGIKLASVELQPLLHQWSISIDWQEIPKMAHLAVGSKTTTCLSLHATPYTPAAHHDQSHYRNWDLWVVTDIKYANRIVLRHNTGRADGGAVEVPIPGPVAGPVGMQVNVQQSFGSSWSVTAPAAKGRDSRVPFAFKAVRLRFTADGELAARRGITMHLGSRSKAPVLRNENEPLPAELLLTANPADMQELFTTTSDLELEALDLQ